MKVTPEGIAVRILETAHQLDPNDPNTLCIWWVQVAYKRA